jgi:hypothetical protein
MCFFKNFIFQSSDLISGGEKASVDGDYETSINFKSTLDRNLSGGAAKAVKGIDSSKPQFSEQVKSL